MKIVFADMPDTEDAVTIDSGLYGIFDTNLGGTNDVKGYSIYSDDYYYIEFTTPLTSGDTAGADFSLAKKDAIDFFVMYRDNSTTYTQVREADGDYDYCTLNVGKKGLLSPEPWFIAASLISTFMVFSYISRKKQKS
jgi:hypothetical protein